MRTMDSSMRADLWKASNPVKFANSLSRLGIIMSASAIVCMPLSARMMRQNLRLPFFFAVAGATFALLFSSTVPETRPKSEAKPFVLVQNNPLSFLVLFRRSMRLRTLCAMQLLTDFAETKGPRTFLNNLTDMHQSELGWTVVDRANYATAANMMRLVSYFVSGRIMRYLGSFASLSLGNAGYVLQALLCASGKLWVSLSLDFVGGTRLNSLNSMIATEAAACGIPQGQLQAGITNMRSLGLIITPMIWSRVYASGVRSGQPGLFWVGIAILICMSQAVGTLALPSQKP